MRPALSNRSHLLGSCQRQPGTTRFVFAQTTRAEQNIEPGGGPPELAVQLLRSDVEIWGQVLHNKHK
jgi:hypothetical protein